MTRWREKGRIPAGMRCRLRTLVLAFRRLEESEWRELKEKLHAAEISLESREDRIAAV